MPARSARVSGLRLADAVDRYQVEGNLWHDRDLAERRPASL
jgi:hypothetical protein